MAIWLWWLDSCGCSKWADIGSSSSGSKNADKDNGTSGSHGEGSNSGGSINKITNRDYISGGSSHSHSKYNGSKVVAIAAACTMREKCQQQKRKKLWHYRSSSDNHSTRSGYGWGNNSDDENEDDAVAGGANSGYGEITDGGMCSRREEVGGIAKKDNKSRLEVSEVKFFVSIER